MRFLLNIHVLHRLAMHLTDYPDSIALISTLSVEASHSMHDQFKNSCVADLAWAIASPPLMRPTDVDCTWYDESWFSRLYDESLSWLYALDEAPAELLTVIAAQKDKRLGKYFETLWYYFFEHSNRFEVLAHNLQIRHENRTLGELDFIVHDRVTQQNTHLELAIKFYLGVGDTAANANWHGPGKQDRLDLKVNNLLKKQSVFSRQAIVKRQLQQANLRVDHCAVIMKGRLFYPQQQIDSCIVPINSHPTHLKSYWYRYSDYSFQHTCRYMPLVKSGWLAGQDCVVEQCLQNKQQLDQQLLSGKLRLPLLLLRYRNSMEAERFFLVLDNWPQGLG